MNDCDAYKGNRNTRQETFSSVALSTTNPTPIGLLSHVDLRGERPASDRLSHSCVTDKLIVDALVPATRLPLARSILIRHLMMNHFKANHHVQISDVSSGILTNILREFLFSAVPATCTAHCCDER